MTRALPTTVAVRHPASAGRIRLRGQGGALSWGESVAPARVDGDSHLFVFPLSRGEIAEFKLIRDERDWSHERNYTVLAGEALAVSPYFDRGSGRFEASPEALYSDGLQRILTYRVWVPPSYDERPDLRYPVLYVQDGQAAFSVTSDDHRGSSWRIDQTLNQLLELGAVEEIIVVGVHTQVERIAMLSPSRDAQHGGGQGDRYLGFTAEVLKPVIDRAYRTRPDREHTAMMGSSMGGLFSFYAAWTRPDVFGKVACLSGSFWWDERFMVREARRMCPVPRPLIYIDSGAAINVFEGDPGVRDGFHHTVALRDALSAHCYAAGVSLHVLTFPGLTHDEASWAARLAIPLQLLFPRGK